MCAYDFDPRQYSITALISTSIQHSRAGGDGRRSVAGTARGPAEAGEWGGPCPVVGAPKTLDLNSAGHQELRDRKVEGQGRRNKLCLARVLALQLRPFRTFGLNYFEKGVPV